MIQLRISLRGVGAHETPHGASITTNLLQRAMGAQEERRGHCRADRDDDPSRKRRVHAEKKPEAAIAAEYRRRYHRERLGPPDGTVRRNWFESARFCERVETLVRRKIRFIAIKEAIEFDGKQDLRTKVMIALFGLFAEVERDLISERTKEGLAAAKAKGKRLGRPKGALGTSRLDGKEQDIRALLGKDVSKASIAKILNVSRSALYHFIETRKIAPG